LRLQRSLGSEMDKLPGVLQLPDDELMLALCVRRENLKDPAKWCQEMRAYWAEKSKPIVDAEHAERLMEWSERLALEAAGERPQGSEDDFGLPVYELGPEDAAFLSYELAVKELGRS
jgi:hypothetical protein